MHDQSKITRRRALQMAGAVAGLAAAGACGARTQAQPQMQPRIERLAPEFDKIIMKAAAVPIGERLIREEAELDRLFATRSVTPVSLAATTQAIGATQAELRNTHLTYHLSTVTILTPEQVRRYGELRGYAGAPPHHGNH